MKNVFSLLAASILWISPAAKGFGHVPEVRHTQPLKIVDHPDSDGISAEAWCAAHMKRGELVQALFDCDYAVERDPRNVQAISNRGSLFLLTNDVEKALGDFEAAVRLAPDRAVSYYNLGLAKARLGRTSDAISDYSRAIELKPDFAIAYHNRAHEYALLGVREKAIADHESALRIQPDLRPASDALARLRKAR